MRSPKSTYVTVFYKDYRSGKGVPKSRQELDGGEESLRVLRGDLLRCKRKLLTRLQKAEKFIEDIEDSEMRTILRKYYINGDYQKDIAEELNYSPGRISQKINTFWLTQMNETQRKD